MGRRPGASLVRQDVDAAMKAIRAYYRAERAREIAQARWDAYERQQTLERGAVYIHSERAMVYHDAVVRNTYRAGQAHAELVAWRERMLAPFKQAWARLRSITG